MINAYVIKGSRRGIPRIIWLLLIAIMLPGCGTYTGGAGVRSIRQHFDFVAAGEPADNRATLSIPWRHEHGIRINAVKVTSLPRKSGIGGNWTMVKLLPGEYNIFFRSRLLTGGREISSYGNFMARNGKSYVLFPHITRKERPESITWYYHGLFLVELPDDFDDQELLLPKMEELLSLKRIAVWR